MSGFLAAGIGSGLEKGVDKVDAYDKEQHRRHTIAQQMSMQERQQDYRETTGNHTMNMQSQQNTRANQSIEQQLAMGGQQLEMLTRENSMLKESQKVAKSQQDYQTYTNNLEHMVFSKGSYMDKLSKVESGGNYKAENKSGATGRYQFMESTAKPYLDKINASWDDFKSNPAVQDKVMAAWTNDNSKQLQKRGHEANQLNLWVAHNQGMGGADAILGNAPMTDAIRRNIAANIPEGMEPTKENYLAHWGKTYGYGSAELPTTDTSFRMEDMIGYQDDGMSQYNYDVPTEPQFESELGIDLPDYIEDDRASQVAALYNGMIKQNPHLAVVAGSAIAPINTGDKQQRDALIGEMTKLGLDQEAFYAMPPQQQNQVLTNISRTGALMWGTSSLNRGMPPSIVDMKDSLVTKGKLATMPDTANYFDHKLAQYSKTIQAINGQYGNKAMNSPESIQLINMLKDDNTPAEVKTWAKDRLDHISSFAESKQSSFNEKREALQQTVNPATGKLYTADESTRQTIGGSTAMNQTLDTARTASNLTPATGFDAAQPITEEDVAKEASVRNDAAIMDTNTKKRLDATLDTAKTVSQMSKLKNDVVKAIKDDEFRSGVFDSVRSWANKLLPKDIKAGLTVSEIESQTKLDARAAMAVSAYIKALSGASYTDNELKDKMVQLSGLWSDQEHIRQATMESFVSEISTDFDKDLKWLESVGLHRTAKDRYKTAYGQSTSKATVEVPITKAQASVNMRKDNTGDAGFIGSDGTTYNKTNIFK